MSARKEKEPEVVVSSATELGLAVYDNVGRVLITGPIANAIHYGSVSLFYIEIGTVLFFLCLFISAYYPEIMLPFALICAGGVGVCFLPLIFLHYIHIPLKLLFILRAKYRKIYFKSGCYELFIELKYKDSKKKRGEWFKRFVRIKQEKALQQEQGDLQQREQEAEEHSRAVFSQLMFKGNTHHKEQNASEHATFEQAQDQVSTTTDTLSSVQTQASSMHDIGDDSSASSSGKAYVQKKVVLRFDSEQDSVKQVQSYPQSNSQAQQASFIQEESTNSAQTKESSDALNTTTPDDKDQEQTDGQAKSTSLLGKVSRIRIRGRSHKVSQEHQESKELKERESQETKERKERKTKRSV